jgi:hypothetical protein
MSGKQLTGVGTFLVHSSRHLAVAAPFFTGNTE